MRARTEAEVVRTGHLCRVYDDRPTFVSAAAAFVADGLALGQRVAYVGDFSIDELREASAGIDLDALVASGTMTVTSLSEVYVGERTSGPAAQTAVYAAAVESALADGFTGLRVAAEATPLVVDRDDRDSFVRYEHLIDQFMADGLAFTAMCGYDRRRLGEATANEVDCVHPEGHGGRPPFRLFAAGGAALALEGEVETLGVDDFARTLARVLPSAVAEAPAMGGEVRLDCSRLRFIDHRSMLTLDAAARDAGLLVRLEQAPPFVSRLSVLLDLSSVRVIAP